MKLLKVLGILLLLTHSASARLGETRSEITNRYGKGDLVDIQIGLPTEAFRFRGLYVFVSYSGNLSVSEGLLGTKDHQHFAEGEIMPLLEAISGNTKWVPMATDEPFMKSWKSGDHIAFHITGLFLEPDKLFVSTEETRRKYRQDKAAEYRDFSSAFAPTNAAPKLEIIEDDPKKLEAARLDREHRQWLADAAKESVRLKKSEADSKLLDFQRKKAEQGDAYGQCALGLRYLKGDGVEKDPKKARTWLEKAAAQGYPEAQTTLATLK